MVAVREFSYVLPLRMTNGDAGDADLPTYLEKLSAWCDDVIVIDGSPEDIYTVNHQLLRHCRHVAVDPARRTLMGKVGGVLTGLDLARHERVVIADDDVRFDRPALERVVDLLETHHLVRPQNYFSPLPWHALWDTARTLINRAAGADYPGTLAVRRSVALEQGGYDGDVLFENLELIRTIQARDGSIITPLDLFVRRLPPAADHFWGQRTRQAYDDFALPARMTLWLSIVPGMILATAYRRPGAMLAALTSAIAVAEVGRRRAGGTRVFPSIASLMAPLWLVERGVCAWLAVVQRLRFGGVRYGDGVLVVAAHSPRVLRARRGGAHRRRPG